MLLDVLDGPRVFGIATLKQNEASDPKILEPFHSIGSIGIVRASQSNDDGTSNVLLQGLMRVRFEQVVQEDPYRIARIQPLQSTTEEQAPYPGMQQLILDLLREKRQNGSSISDEAMDFLENIQDPESFIEFASYSACDNLVDKLQLLKTTETLDRFNLLSDCLTKDIERIRFFKQLQEGLKDEQIGLN